MVCATRADGKPVVIPNADQRLALLTFHRDGADIHFEKRPIVAWRLDDPDEGPVPIPIGWPLTDHDVWCVEAPGTLVADGTQHSEGVVWLFGDDTLCATHAAVDEHVRIEFELRDQAYRARMERVEAETAARLAKVLAK